ncbi:MAG: enoyl-CoA hydratase-related protein [Gammaproteobacteria bacterium]|tara:strand:+ start:118 stop:924 length:807 start_codon:yes stop_codon:yes gene_type:complete
MGQEVKTELNDKGVLTVTLNRPESLNSLNYGLVMGVIAAFDEARENESIRSVILTGEGRGFCSGADLTGGNWPNEEGWSAGQSAANSMEIGMNPMIKKIVNCPKPVINAINGIAAGGGAGLALSGDILIAAKSAKFKLVFGNQLGIISDVGASWFVPNLLSRARANGLAMLGDDLSAEQAEEWGLLWKTFNDDILMEEAMKIASKLADGAIEGLKAIVHSHDHALISSLDDQLEYEKKTQRKLCDAPPFKEGIMAFLEKRKPNFRNLK